jgi:hypothetical protein
MSVSGCRDVRDKLFDYLDGNLNNRIATSVEAHLATCDACRRELERCRATLALLSQAKVEPPEDFKDKVMARIAAEGTGPDSDTAKQARVLTPHRIFARRFGTFAAAAVLIAVMAVGWRVLPAFLQKTDLAKAEEAELYSSEQSTGARDSKVAADDILEDGGTEAPENPDSILMFSLPGVEDELDYDTAPETRGNKGGDMGGGANGSEGTGEAGTDKRFFAPGMIDRGETEKALAPDVEWMIREYAPEFAGKAAQVVIIRTGSPAEDLPGASASVKGEGYSAYLIDESTAIAEAEKLADSLGGERYGKPGGPLVWIEFYD